MQNRKRSYAFVLRLNKQEYDKLESLVKESGQPREEYIRSLINGLTPIPALPIDFYKMIQELNAIGNNLNQISRKANALHIVNAIEYQEFAKSLDKVILAIMDECMNPKGKPT